jgi:hypothetical protein
LGLQRLPPGLLPHEKTLIDDLRDSDGTSNDGSESDASWGDPWCSYAPTNAAPRLYRADAGVKGVTGLSDPASKAFEESLSSYGENQYVQDPFVGYRVESARPNRSAARLPPPQTRAQVITGLQRGFRHPTGCGPFLSDFWRGDPGGNATPGADFGARTKDHWGAGFVAARTEDHWTDGRLQLILRRRFLPAGGLSLPKSMATTMPAVVLGPPTDDEGSTPCSKAQLAMAMPLAEKPAAFKKTLLERLLETETCAPRPPEGPRSSAGPRCAEAGGRARQAKGRQEGTGGYRGSTGGREYRRAYGTGGRTGQEGMSSWYSPEGGRLGGTVTEYRREEEE